MMSRPTFASLALCLLLPLSGCWLAASDEASLNRGGGGLGELILAGVTELSVPPQVQPGESFTVTVRGEHPDGCTTFERFETAYASTRIDLTAWSFRPLGDCDLPPSSFEAQTTLAALEPGLYTVRVNDRLEETVAVIGAGSGPPLCQESPQVTLGTVTLPPATHLLGGAELTVSGSLPSWCDQLLSPTIGVTGDVVQVEIAAEGCVLTAYDPAACPEGPQPFFQRIPLTFPAEGSWRVVINGQSFGTVEVVPTSSCRLSTLEVLSLEAPARVEEHTTFAVALEGALPSECAAVDTIAVDASSVTIVIDPVVRECSATCAPLQTSAPVRAETLVEGLPVGSWTLTVAGDPRTWPLEVVAAGTCAPVPLPAGSVEQVLITTDLAYVDALAGQPLDVSVYGSLPQGCWDPPSLFGEVSGSVLALRTESANCARDCNAAGMSFVASLAFPEGLAAGSYEVTVDGSTFTTLTVE
ncbi:MAG: hypothetical protein P1V51_05125 [Deltaproteobacteria bacterium]|nr:hypothetical protein [Deltaproteobacteria bacterium]